MTTPGVAEAQRARAAAGQPTKAARAKAPPARPMPAPAVRALVPSARRGNPSKPKPPADAGIAANVLLVQYQRVGRELMLVSNERAAKTGVESQDAKLSCAELQALFRSINPNDAVATPESRAETAALLSEIHAKIVRLRGIEVTRACLDNPLAKDCT